MTNVSPPPMKKEILRMLAGFKRFHTRFYTDHPSVYDRLSSAGQKPKTLMIACSDSRVDPAILFSSSPGKIFMVRNVANLVPPFESDLGFHGVSAAIEFAVVNLQVENVVILGHRQCGGIRSLFDPRPVKVGGFVSQWMKIAEPAKQKALANLPHGDEEGLCREGEKTSIVISLQNLRTFPFINEAIRDRGLELIGAYFDLEKGELSYWDESIGAFHDLSLHSLHDR